MSASGGLFYNRRVAKKPVFLLLCLALAAAPVSAEVEDYVDALGDPVTAPDAKKSFSAEKPGVWKAEAAFHDPAVKSRKLVQGLETTRILTVSVPHPLDKTGNKNKQPIKAIYLVEKDGMLIGYDSFSEDDAKQVVYETRMNGVINYVEIFVECRRHGMWHKKVYL